MVPALMKPICYAQRDWELRRALITQLYATENLSLAEVVASLARQEFFVNRRMLKARIQRWKLDRKHKWPEMRTAIQLLPADRAKWTTQAPRFMIRRRLITYAEVLRYFRRRKIADPLQWVQEHTGDGFVASPDVELATPESSPDNTDSESSGSGRGEVSETATEVTPLMQDFLDLNFHGDCPLHLQMTSQISNALTYANVHRPADVIVHHMRDYVACYLESPNHMRHAQPKIHRLTTHAIFGGKMQDGISLILNGNTTIAFEHFRAAFNLLQPLLDDDHPMALALLMAIICELSRHRLGPVVRQLTTHVSNMASVKRHLTHPIIVIFKQLSQNIENNVELVLAALRRALQHLVDYAGVVDWKTLYLKERLCDCLYHAHVDGERSSLRRQLLVDQERTCGMTARNTLWTVMNVADDAVQAGRLEEGERLFREALRRTVTEQEGFGRAKTRFAALEGLAGLELVKTELASRITETGLETLTDQDRYEGIQRALDLLTEAELEASTWFEASSRRTARVKEKKSYIIRLLEIE